MSPCVAVFMANISSGIPLILSAEMLYLPLKAFNQVNIIFNGCVTVLPEYRNSCLILNTGSYSTGSVKNSPSFKCTIPGTLT